MNFLEFAWSLVPTFAHATRMTLIITAGSIALGFAAGVLLALGRVYGFRPIRWLTAAYIEFFRGTPLLVQILVVYYGLPPFLSPLGIRLKPIVAAIIGLGLNSAAYQAEYFRGAVQSIQSGQMMAARAVGLSRLSSIRHVILPQALRLVIPSWSNELIYSIKYSSLAYFLGGIRELTFEAKDLASDTARTFEVYIVVAIFYLAIVLIVSLLLHKLEQRVRIPGLGAPAEHR